MLCYLLQEDEDFIEEHWPALQEKAQAAAEAAAAEAEAAADAAAAAEAAKACRQAAAKAKAKAKAAAAAGQQGVGAGAVAGVGGTSVTGGGSWQRDQHSKQDAAAAGAPKLGRKSAHKYAKYGGLPVAGGAAEDAEGVADDKQPLTEQKSGSDQQRKQQQQLLQLVQAQPGQQQQLQQLHAQQQAILGQQQLLQVLQQQQLAKLEGPPGQPPSWVVISRPLPPAAAAAGSGANLQQQQRQRQRQPSLSQLLPVSSGLVLSPAGSLSAATAAAAAAPSPAAAPLLTSPQQQQQQQQRPRFVSPRGAQPSKLWLHDLVSCGYLLKPCPLCTGSRKGRSSTGRDKLIRYFDPVNPAKGYCNYCPELPNLMHGLLHVSRAQQISSDFHFVRASDVMALADVAGVQQYPLNGQQVLYLRPRPQQNRGYRCVDDVLLWCVSSAWFICCAVVQDAGLLDCCWPLAA
jgi:hypothetical protein